jgi:uncharacterized protein YndB with AHSA1/START domain
MVRLEHGKIVIEMTIHCAREDAWRLLIDTQQWPRWGPSVSTVACDHRFIGPDSKGRVKTQLGFWVPFAITEYRDQRFWSWRIGRFPATGHRLSIEDETTCMVAFDMPWWALPYLIVCRIALGRIRRLLTTDGRHS